MDFNRFSIKKKILCGPVKIANPLYSTNSFVLIMKMMEGNNILNTYEDTGCIKTDPNFLTVLAIQNSTFFKGKLIPLFCFQFCESEFIFFFSVIIWLFSPKMIFPKEVILILIKIYITSKECVSKYKFKLQ